MKKFCFLIILLTALSCSNNPQSFIEHLNGYWEIDEVTLPDGTKRDYNYNATIDYFKITDSLTGYRTKLKPNFDGSYSTSNDTEVFKIIIENDSLQLYYTTPFSKWKETVLNATETQLLIQNEQKIRYLYKHYEPLDLE